MCECMYVCVCTWERTQCLCRLPAAGPQTLLRVESAAQPTLWHSQFRFNQIFPSDNNISGMSFWMGLSITQVFDYSHFLSFRMNSKLRCQHTAIFYNSERKKWLVQLKLCLQKDLVSLIHKGSRPPEQHCWTAVTYWQDMYDFDELMAVAVCDIMSNPKGRKHTALGGKLEPLIPALR